MGHVWRRVDELVTLTNCRSPAARASHDSTEREGHARASPGAVRCSGRLARSQKVLLRTGAEGQALPSEPRLAVSMDHSRQRPQRAAANRGTRNTCTHVVDPSARPPFDHPRTNVHCFERPPLKPCGVLEPPRRSNYVPTHRLYRSRSQSPHHSVSSRVPASDPASAGPG
jgi:hypothetical protein